MSHFISTHRRALLAGLAVVQVAVAVVAVKASGDDYAPAVVSACEAAQSNGGISAGNCEATVKGLANRAHGSQDTALRALEWQAVNCPADSGMSYVRRRARASRRPPFAVSGGTRRHGLKAPFLVRAWGCKVPPAHRRCQ